MNDILNLKGSFNQNSSNRKPGSPKLPGNTIVKTEQIKNLITYLLEMKRFWQSQTILNGCLISVYYNKIAAKVIGFKDFFHMAVHSLIQRLLVLNFQMVSLNISLLTLFL